MSEVDQRFFHSEHRSKMMAEIELARLTGESPNFYCPYTMKTCLPSCFCSIWPCMVEREFSKEGTIYHVYGYNCSNCSFIGDRQ